MLAQKGNMHTRIHTQAQTHATIFNSMCPQLMDDFSGNLIEMTFTVAGLPRC